MNIKPGQPAVALRVQFTCLIPNGMAREEQINEWLNFVLGNGGQISQNNPLVDLELEAIRKPDWQPIGAGVMRHTNTNRKDSR